MQLFVPYEEWKITDLDPQAPAEAHPVQVVFDHMLWQYRGGSPVPSPQRNADKKLGYELHDVVQMISSFQCLYFVLS